MDGFPDVDCAEADATPSANITATAKPIDSKMLVYFMFLPPCRPKETSLENRARVGFSAPVILLDANICPALKPGCFWREYS